MSEGIVIDYLITYVLLLCFFPMKSRFQQEEYNFPELRHLILVETVFFSGDPSQTPFTVHKYQMW